MTVDWEKEARRLEIDTGCTPERAREIVEGWRRKAKEQEKRKQGKEPEKG